VAVVGTGERGCGRLDAAEVRDDATVRRRPRNNAGDDGVDFVLEPVVGKREHRRQRVRHRVNQRGTRLR
jgi:hypothetical protein